MTPPPSTIAITGIGAISATGRGLESMDAALREGREGLGPVALWKSSLEPFPVGQYRGNLEADLLDCLPIRHKWLRRMSRSDMLALVAAAEAFTQAALKPGMRIGAYVGQSVCGTLSSETVYIESRHTDRDKRYQVAGLLAHEGANTLDWMARLLGLNGPTLSLMTACSSGANAIGLAADAVRSGRADVMLAGGADSLSRIGYNGFCSLKVVSPDGPRPFDKQRQGMMVGEGAGILVLETLEHANARGAKVLALLTGYGHSCDAHHLTAPHPEGKGAVAAMREALTHAGLVPSDIGYINAHGTATLDNDRTEGLAIHEVFGNDVPVSSTKRFFGHTLAAAGGIEAVVCVWALMSRLLPPNLGLREAEDENLALVRELQPAAGLRHALSNSFGFGGNNAALVFSKA